MANVLYSKQNNIGYVTINREESMNCFNYDTLQELKALTDSISLDSEVRAVIFTGAGDKAFSAGADLKERRTLSESEVLRNVKAIRDTF
ncbi:MAG: enoyl-CoA hydratase/isomerase family protein, partial [Firmicutes bacterium]|nr:enoyl-CoA hydratase/isomerase family protein [Bacillota bacterium]